MRTSASASGVWNRSWRRKVTRPETPAARALSFDSRIRAGSMSTPKPRGAVAAGGGDQDAAVARAEVDDVIVGPDLGEAEHRVDHFEVGRDIGDVEPRPALDEGGRIEAVAGLRLRRLLAAAEEEERQPGQQRT